MASRQKIFAEVRTSSKIGGYKPIGRIHKAARSGDVKRVRRLLVRGGCHVNDIDKKNRTPLHYACAYGQAKVVDLLIKKKCNIHLCDSDNNTPLIKAIQEQEEECVTILLENGADLNVQNPSGETPFHHAVYTDNISIAAKLLSHNANIEAQNKDGYTPLLLALKENKHYMAEFLIKAKANVHAVDNRGRTALMLAMGSESPGIINLLIEEGVDVFAEDHNGGTALCYSVASGYNMKIIFDCTRAKHKIGASTSKVYESSKDDPLIRCSDKPGPSDSTPNEGKNQPDTKDHFQQSSKDDAKSVTGTQENKTLFDHSGTECQKEDKAGVTLAQSISLKHSYKPSFSASNSKHLSADNNQREQKIGKHVEDVGPMSSHMGGSRNDMVAKSQDTRIDSVSMSPKVLQEKIPDLKSTTTKQDILPKKLVGMKDMRILHSEPHSDVTPEDGAKTLHGTKKKWAKPSYGNTEQEKKQRIKENVEDVGLTTSPLAESRNDNVVKTEDTRIDSVPMSPKESKSDVKPEDVTKTLHGPKKKWAKRFSGNTKQENKQRIKDHVEDVGLTTSPLAESRNDNVVKTEDTRIDSVPMSPKESKSDVKPEDGTKTLHGPKKKWAKRFSGNTKQENKQRIKDHVEDVGLTTSPLAESRNDNVVKTEDTRIDSVPMSPKESKSHVKPEDGTKTLHGPKKKWAKRFSGNTKQENKQRIKDHVEDVGLTTSPLSESRNDNVVKTEDTRIDSVPMSPKESKSDVKPEDGTKTLHGPKKKWAKRFSGNTKQENKQRIKDHVEDVGLTTSPLAESRNDNVVKTEDTRIDSVPMSPKESKSDVKPEDGTKTLHGPKKKWAKRFSGNTKQENKQRIKDHVEDVGLTTSPLAESRNDNVVKTEDTRIDSVPMSPKESKSDVKPEDGTKTLHGPKKKWAKRFSGNTKQENKQRIKDHVEDVGLTTSPLAESRNDNMVKTEDTRIDSVPMSPKESKSDVKPEDVTKTLHGPKKKWAKRFSGNTKQENKQRIKDHVEDVGLTTSPLAESRNDNVVKTEDTRIDSVPMSPKESKSDVKPEDGTKTLHGPKKKWAKRFSGNTKQENKQRIKDHVEDVGLMTSPLAESRNDNVVKTEDTRIDSVPMSPKESNSDVKPEDGTKILHGSKKNWAKRFSSNTKQEKKQRIKKHVEDVGLTSSPLAESRNDNAAKTEDTRIDSVPMSPKVSNSDAKPEDGTKTLHGSKKKWAKPFSGNTKQEKKQRIKKHVEDVGLMSSPLAESRTDNMAKTEDTRIDSVPMSPKELNSDAKPEDETKTLHGSKKKWAKRFSGNTKQEKKQRIKEHVEDVGLMSSPLTESKNDNTAKIEDTRIDSVPMSPKELNSDAKPEDETKTLHGSKKKWAKRFSSNTKEEKKQRVKEHVESVGLKSPPLPESRNDNMTETEDTRINSVPMSPKEPHSDVTSEIGTKSLHVSTKKQHSSCDANQGGEQKIKDHVEDDYSMSSSMTGSRISNVVKPDDTEIDSVSMSSSAEAHLEVTPKKGLKPLNDKEKKKSKGCFESLLKIFNINSSKNLHGDANQTGEEKVKRHVEEPSLKVKAEEKKKVLGGPENKQPQVEIKLEKYKINKLEVSQILHHSDEDTGDNGDHQCFFLKKNEEHDGPTEKTTFEINKVKNQTNALEDLDGSQSPLTASQVSEVAYPNYRDIWMLVEQPSTSRKDSHSLPKIKEAVDSCQEIELEKIHPSQGSLPMKEVAKLENKICVLKEELSEVENAKSKLQQNEIKWKQVFFNLRHDLKEKEKKLRDFDQLCEKMNNQLRETEEKYEKEVELNQELQLFSGILKTELKTARSNLNKVSSRNETEKELLDRYHMLQDEFAMIRFEMDTMKHQNQEDKKEYLEVIDILREKNDDLQRTVKLNEETLIKTISQYNEQIHILKTEITKLKCELEYKEENTERQETEVKSYPASQAVAEHPFDENQIPKRELGLPFQRARDGCLGLKDEENFKISKLNVGSEILPQKFSKTGIKISRREKELCSHMRRDLRKVTVTLKQVQRQVKQNQCQINEMKHMYQNEQSQNYNSMEEQMSIDEKLSQMESEVTWLLQQSQEIHKIVDDKNALLDYTQEQCNIIKMIQDDAEYRHVELMNEYHHFKERSNQYKKKKSKREVVLRQPQQELTDNQTEQSVPEASSEHSPSSHLNREDEIQELKKRLDQVVSQVEDLNVNLGATFSKYLQQDEKYEYYLKSLKNIYEKLESNQKKLEDVANLKQYVPNNLIEHDQGVQQNWETEQRTRQQLEENQEAVSLFSETPTATSKALEEELKNNEALMINLMQRRIHRLQCEIQVEEHDEFHVEEYKIQNPQRINESLQEVNTRFPMENQTDSLPCPHCRRPVPGCPCVKLQNDSWARNRRSRQGENIAGSTSNPQPSCQSIEDYLAEMDDKLNRGFI